MSLQYPSVLDARLHNVEHPVNRLVLVLGKRLELEAAWLCSVCDWELHWAQIVYADGYLPALPAMGYVELLLCLDEAPDEPIIEIDVLDYRCDEVWPDALGLLVHDDLVV